MGFTHIGPLLKDLSMWGCCDHCKDKYCPERKGHYVVCPIKDCADGHTKIEKGGSNE